MLRTGSSYLSQSDISTVIVGLGLKEKADSIKITWPRSGKETVISAFKPGSTVIIKEE